MRSILLLAAIAAVAVSVDVHRDALLSADVASAEAEEAVDFESFAEEQLAVEDTAEEELTLEDTAGEQMVVEDTLEEAEDAEHPHPIQHGSTGGFAVVVDVGTTGTRTTLFSWKALAKYDWLPIVKKLRALRSDNPLTSSSPKSMGMKALSALFKRLRTYLPKGVSPKHVQVFYASTMSVDPPSGSQNAILQQAIATIEAAGFHVVEKKTWSGQEEGMMEYISVQAYAFGEKKNQPLTGGQMITQPLGSIHLGGSSMNVVFHPANGQILNHHYKMALGNSQELSVYAASFPRFGVNAARDRILSIVALTHAASLQGKAKKQIEQHHKSHSKTPLPAHLLEATRPGVTPSGVLAAFRRANIAAKKPATESALPHPCYPKGLLMKGVSTWAIDGKLDVIGTGNYKACRNLMREIIHRGGVCYTDPLPYGPVKKMPTHATPYGFAPEAGFTRAHPAEQSKKAGHSSAEVDVAPSHSTCSISGTYQPSTKGVSFYAFGSISHAYEALKLPLASSSLLDFAVAIKRECFALPAHHEKGKYIKGKKQTWKDLKAKHPKTPEKHLRNMCADGVYLSTLLLEGLHLDGHRKGVVKVLPSDAHMNWAHGALFSHLVSERLSLAGQQGEHDDNKPKLPSHTPMPSHTHSPLPHSQTPYPSMPGPAPGSASPTPFPSHHKRGSHSPTPFPSPHHHGHASHTHSPLPRSQTPYPSMPGGGPAPGPVGGSHSPSPLPHSQTPYPTPMAQPGGGGSHSSAAAGAAAHHQKAVHPNILPGNVGPDREVYSAVKLGEELQRKAQKLLAETTTTTSSEGGAAAAKAATEADSKEKEGIPARVLRGASTTTKSDDELDVKMTLHWDSIKDGDNGAHTTTKRRRHHHHKKHKKAHHE